MTGPILDVAGLVKHYRLPRARPFGPAGIVAAVDHVDFAIEKGRSLGIVGESGSGKSTLARAVMALEKPTAGTIRMLGRDFAALSPAELRKLRRGFQMVFQDPYGSLDPRSTVASIVAEPLEVLDEADRAGRRQRVQLALEAVGLRASALDKYPHEFSGGQRQRIAIARALVTEPALVVADEPVSALDVSVQAQVLNLLLDLRDRYGLSYLLISHDLAIVEYVCDAAAVMYRGRIVERAATRDLFLRPAHPYTRLLLEAVPRPLVSRKRHLSIADTDQDDSRQGGCAFRARCPFAQPRCAEEAPPLREFAPAHWSACHFAENVAEAPRI
jgi:peptide/nickel transport system ATP-binding protein